MTAYRDAVLEIVIRERDDALNRLHTLRALLDRRPELFASDAARRFVNAAIGPHDHTENTP